MVPELMVKDKVLVNNAALTNGATNFQTFDCLDAHFASVRVIVAAGSGETVTTAVGLTSTLQESDVTNQTTFATLQTGLGPTQGPTKNSCEIRWDSDRRGQKRYLGISTSLATAGGTNETFTITVLGSLSRKDNSPATTSDLVTSTNDLCAVG